MKKLFYILFFLSFVNCTNLEGHFFNLEKKNLILQDTLFTIDSDTIDKIKIDSNSTVFVYFDEIKRQLKEKIIKPPPRRDFKKSIGNEARKDYILIYNATYDTKLIELGYMEDLRRYRIYAHENWVSIRYYSNPIFKIKTKDFTKTYQLLLGAQYIIFWNDKKKYWDLMKLKM